jgi:hypothetical protein
MLLKKVFFLAPLSLIFLISGCKSRIDVETTFENPTANNSIANEPLTEEKVGFEIIEIQSKDSFRAWVSNDISRDEYSSLKLPLGWFKNQPREVTPDAGRFLKSPFTESDGEFLIGKAFGYNWWHSATVIERNISLDDENLLKASKVHKYHEISFNAGRVLSVLISPEGDPYVLISRDADRTKENPSIPDGWSIEEYHTKEELTFMLPEEVLVIRTDNEDSYQGPVQELKGIFR